MMKNRFLWATCLSALAFAPVGARDLLVSTNNTSLLLRGEVGETLRFAYYGDKIQPAETGVCPSLNFDAYPVFGSTTVSPTVLQMEHADGNVTLDLEITDIATTAGPRGDKLVVTLRDKLYPTTVRVCYEANTQSDIIEVWSEITNGEKKPVVLNHFDSAFMPIRRGNVWMSHLHGTWAAEASLVETPLTTGVVSVTNQDGARNAHLSRPEVMFSLDGKPSENHGRVIGAVLCWNGNYDLSVDTDDKDVHYFTAGIKDYASQYHLNPGSQFVTPRVAFTYSDRGVGGASRNYHNWARSGMIHGGDKVRDILLNSWEGVYFDITEPGVAQMMNDIAQLGGELFVLDDGWFGTKYARKDDRKGLGDWWEDPEKLPHGIQGLIDNAKKAGVKFGIWIEPEYANVTSELYEKHPDWVLQAGKRPLTCGRGGTQVILDLTNPAVQDFVVGVVDGLFGKYPDLYYIKWDANGPIANYGSAYQPKDRQSNIYVDYHKALDSVLKRVRTKYPDRVIQACGSGGGRANYGVMPYFDEFWVSDNTDALQRIYMQWGTSYFFPSMAMAQHVSASPNHQTGRIVPIKFRFDVASTGRLGMEIQPSKMTPEEYAFSKVAIANYKQFRDIVQLGDQYRLVSPYDNRDMASLMYVSSDKSRAVVFAYKLQHFLNQHFERLCLDGLDPEASYRITEMNVPAGKQPCKLDGQVLTGRMLMNTGLDVNLSGEYASRVLMLTKN